MSETMLEAAVNLTEHGYSVFPLAVNAKLPKAGSNGYLSATDDSETVEGWWTANPDQNLGIATTGLVVVDIDPDGKQWYASLPPDQQEDLNSTMVCGTPRGGSHHYFRQLPGRPVRLSAGGIAKGIDIRADGGYCVAAPSYVIDRGKNINGPYRWRDGKPWERSELPVVPMWLQQMFDNLQKEKPSVRESLQTGEQFPEGTRNDSLFRIGCYLRRTGLSESAIRASLDATNQERCNPPLDDDEIADIAASAANYEPDQTTVAVLEDWAGQDAKQNGPRFTLIDSDQFHKAEYTRRYLVKDILAEGQNCIIGGPSKSLKTSFAIDLALSIGTATPFLGEFTVNESARVAVMSGESGGYTLQETARRIAAYKEIELSAAKVLWGFELPQVSSADDLHDLEAMITDHEVEVLILDPLYLCLLGIDFASQASNVFAMGPHLQHLSAIGDRTGCTMICLHHTKKSTARTYEPLGLEDLAMAGFAEWARQWILVNHREEYEPGTGMHNMWMVNGGSAGHNGLYAVDVDEGTFDTYGGRKWLLSLENGSQVRKEKAEERERAKEHKQEQAVEGRKLKILQLLRKADYADGLTMSAIADKVNISRRNCAHSLEQLVDEDAVMKCQVVPPHRKNAVDGYRINKLADTADNLDGQPVLSGKYLCDGHPPL